METTEQQAERVKRCVEKINAVLAEEHCAIKPRVNVANGKIQTGVDVLAEVLPSVEGAEQTAVEQTVSEIVKEGEDVQS